MKFPFFHLAPILILAACSEPTVQSACYKNGPHDRMSDGRIVRICECVDKAVAEKKLSPKQTGWVITLLNQDEVEGLTQADKDSFRRTSMMLSDVQGQCQIK